MARIPDEELERVKRESDLVGLVRGRGVELVRQGKDLVGRCPFHSPDQHASLVVTAEKGLWHCFGCGAGGTVLDWVMRTEGVSLRHAYEILNAGGPPPAWGAAPVGKSTTLKLAPAVDLEASDEELVQQVLEYYQATLKTSPEALAYLRRRGIDDPEGVRTFRLGYANRTLGLRLPAKTRDDGVRIRHRLTELGILRSSGHEHYSGAITFPVVDGDGRVAEIYGRKVRDDLRDGTAYHLYRKAAARPEERRGVWNLDGVRGQGEVILCEAIIDALSFWCAGFRNVTASYGTNGFTAGHLEVFEASGVERVLIAYDRDEAGEQAAEGLAKRLAGAGITSFRVRFPHGLDANAYACRVTPAAQSLGVLLRGAEHLAGPLVWPVGGGGREAGGEVSARPADPAAQRPALDGSPPVGRQEPLSFPAAAAAVAAATATAGPPAAESPGPEPPAPPAPAPGTSLGPRAPRAPERTPAPGPVASPVPAAAAAPQPVAPPPAPPASPVPAAPPPEIAAEVGEGEVVLRFEGRRWRARGLGKSLSFEALRVNLLVGLEGHPERFHQDTVDLYSARQRQVYVRVAAGELGVKEDTVKRDLGQVLLKLEQLQEQQIRAALEPKVKAVAITEPDRRAALELLRDPHLLDRILADFERCGVVGEETNKLVGYLAAVSRKLETPLAVLVQSSTAAGKSALMNAVLAFVPEEERVAYSAMTGQSLFYMAEADLEHKLLAIAEEEGASRASYALKLLLSEGELSIASTAKDPATGELLTRTYEVKGPVAIFTTTTAVDLDEELRNRCLVLAVSEEREQTRAIHRMQRERRTLEGIRARRQRAEVLALHQNAQRLLRPLAVANPYAARLTFLDDKTTTRRDHDKYLTLIEAIALLHQHQRSVHSDPGHASADGRPLEYIEVTLDDIATANRLANEVLGHTLDELPPQTRRLLELLDGMVGEACRAQGVERTEHRFTSRQVREHTGWGSTQVKVHLARLIDMEYVLVHRGGRGQSFVLELLYAGEGRDGTRFLPALLDVAALRQGDTQRPRPDPDLPGADPPAADPDRSGLAGERSASVADRSGPRSAWSGSSRPQVGVRSGGCRREPDGRKPSSDGHPGGNGAKRPENADLQSHEPTGSYPDQGRSAAVAAAAFRRRP